MPLSNELFRESALEQLSSPEQLDRLLQVTSPRGWVALTAIWALIAVLVAWAFLGTVPTKEIGQGIIVPGGGLKVVESTGSGRLNLESIAVGETIRAGEIVGTIEKLGLHDELREATAQLEMLKRQNTELDAFDRAEAIRRADLTAAEKERLDSTIEIAEKRLVRLEEKRPIVLRLIDDGVMTDIDRHEIDEQLESAALEREQAELRKRQLDEKLEDARLTRNRERMKREIDLTRLRSTVDLLQGRLDRETSVRSTVTGRIVEVRVPDQTVVAAGDPILLVEPVGSDTGDLEAVVFVSAATAKGRILAGDDVALVPSTVKQEEYGFLKGTVISVASVPTSKSRMFAVLADNDLVARFTQEIGLPLEMHVALRTDASTSSGYEWSTKQGPPTLISAGTLCKASVTVEEQMPLSLIIPQFRRAAGDD